MTGEENQFADTELPPDWTGTTLNELGRLHCGQSPPSAEVNGEGQGTPYIPGPESWDGEQMRVYKWTTAPKRIVPDGCVFVTVKGAGAGKMFPGVSAAIGRDIYAFEPTADVEPEYLLGAMSRAVDRLRTQASGDIPGLNKGQILDLPVFLPDRVEQRRIVAAVGAVTGRADAAAARLRATLPTLARYRRSVLAAACDGRLTADWREQHPGDAAELKAEVIRNRLAAAKPKGRGKSLLSPAADLDDLPEAWETLSGDEAFSFVTSGSRGWAKYYADAGPAFLRVGNFDRCTTELDLSDVQAVDPPDNAERRRTRVEPGDVLITVTADVGMVGLVPHDLGEAYVNQHVAIARPAEGYCREFVALALASPSSGQRQFEELRYGATKQGLNLTDIRTLAIPLPPLPEQHEIVRRTAALLARADAAEARVRAALAAADRLRRSALAKAFRGELLPPAPPTAADGHGGA